MRTDVKTIDPLACGIAGFCLRSAALAGSDQFQVGSARSGRWALPPALTSTAAKESAVAVVEMEAAEAAVEEAEAAEAGMAEARMVVKPWLPAVPRKRSWLPRRGRASFMCACNQTVATRGSTKHQRVPTTMATATAIRQRTRARAEEWQREQEKG